MQSNLNAVTKRDAKNVLAEPMHNFSMHNFDILALCLFWDTSKSVFKIS